MYRLLPQQIADFGVDEIFTIDAEYRSADPDGYEKYGLPPDLVPDALEPICLSVKAWTTGDAVTFWARHGEPCPFKMDEKTVVLCFQAPAEWSYFLAMGWELPSNIIDIYAEYRLVVNGQFDWKGSRVGQGEHKNADGRTKYGLLSACLQYGIKTRAGSEKKSMVARILEGAPFSGDDREAIMQYNRDDVEDTERLFAAMMAKNDIGNIGQALQRGDATRGFAVRELNGLPIHAGLAMRLHTHWEKIRSGLAQRVESRQHYDVFRFDPDGMAHFDQSKMSALVERLGMQTIWPKNSREKYSFADPERGSDEDKPFKKMALINPYLEDLRETKRLLEQFKHFTLPIGKDGRCHSRYAPWTQVTSRSSPGKGSIFAMPAWARWLIRPGEGQGVAYVDLKSAEFGIGAALSHDENMKQDYTDMLAGTIECVYFEVAKRAGQVPPDARLEDHKSIRKLWKTGCLAMMYGQSPEGLSNSAGISLSQARVIQDSFKRRYKTYWAWTEREVVHGHIRGRIETVCGWRMEANQRTKDGTLLNFHPQATCADIMRRAVTLMADSCVAICEIVHDAVMIEDAIDSIDRTVQIAQTCWREASWEILGFELDADAKVFKYPHHYEDEDGRSMWNVLTELLSRAEEGDTRIEGEIG